jgi:hypothetical protein
MKKAILVLSILVSLFMVGIVFAEMLNREAALRWDAPEWGQTYGVASFDTPITATLFSLTGTVRLVDSNGVVVDSQPVEISGCEPGATAGSGQCGAAYSWSWDTDNYAKSKGVLTEQVKIAWVAPDWGVELPTVWAPANCDLSGAGCTIEFDQSSWTVSIPQSCRDALASCGVTQDEDGWWSISTFRGTKTWTWCLPLLVTGDAQ